MQRLIMIFSVLIFTSVHTLSKNLDTLSSTEHKEFYLDWDNDMWIQKDYYYTQGAKFNLVNPGLRKNPINHMLFSLNGADNYFGLGLIQEIYTPKDVHDSLVNVVDRPYAGTLFARSFIISNNPLKRIRLTSQLDIGVLGPLAGAEMAQRYIHEWLDLGVPSGWDFQIDTRPYLNYNVLMDIGLVELPGRFELVGTSRLRIGNIHDDLQLGALMRVGLLNSYFKGNRLSNMIYTENRDLQIYLFGGVSASAVAYNATLMGGIVPPESTHQFTLKQIKHVVAEYNGGLYVSYKKYGACIQTTFKSPEFDGGVAHGWGTVSLNLRF